MNYYEILGVSEKANEEEIKNAYKKQIKKWHPDINKSSDAINISSKINEAKEILLDPIKRKDYDNFLKQKSNEEYNKYTQRKHQNNYNNNNKQNNTVSKWEYLKQWNKYADLSKFRKFIGTIGVLIESFICFIIKIIIILISFISCILSDLIKEFFKVIYPILLLLGGIFILTSITNGLNNAINENKELFLGIIISLSTYILSFLLPLLAKFLLSEKVFNLLYNKIDINLFKKCVGIK